MLCIGTCLCLSFILDILMYILGMGVIATLALGIDGIHSCFILLFSHIMLFTSLEDILLKTTTRPLWVRVLLFIYDMILCLFCSYCYDYCSLYFLSLLLAFVESVVSRTLRRLAGNPSRQISLPFYFITFKEAISIKFSLEINWIKLFISFFPYKLDILSHQNLNNSFLINNFLKLINNLTTD